MVLLASSKQSEISLKVNFVSHPYTTMLPALGARLTPLRLLASLDFVGYGEQRRHWAQRVLETGAEDLSRHVSRIPNDWIGDLSRSFAERIIQESFAQIVEGL